METWGWRQPAPASSPTYQLVVGGARRFRAGRGPLSERPFSSILPAGDGLMSRAMPRERAGASEQARLIFEVMDSQRSRRARAGKVEGCHFWYLGPWIITNGPRAIRARFPGSRFPGSRAMSHPSRGFVEAAAHDAGRSARGPNLNGSFNNLETNSTRERPRPPKRSS